MPAALATSLCILMFILVLSVEVEELMGGSVTGLLDIRGRDNWPARP